MTDGLSTLYQDLLGGSYDSVDRIAFHILDRDWGHLTIKISGHPPFPAQVIEHVGCGDWR